MELRVLQYFLAIAREENISNAASFLHITQPTLSRQMKELEDELGTLLFVRGNRKITLTEDGQLLRKRAEEILSLVDKTTSELLNDTLTLQGDVYIGAGETKNALPIAKIIHQIQLEFPDMTFHLFSGNAMSVLERLDKGLLDFALIIGEFDVSKYEAITLPLKDTWGVIMRKDDPMVTHQVITPADLDGKPLIVSAQGRHELERWMKNAHPLHVVADYNLIYNASLLVQEHIGYAITLDHLLFTGEHSPFHFIPLEPKIESKITLVWKKYQVFSKSADYFLSSIKHYFQIHD